VYLWMPMVIWGVVRLLCALIDWRARISYERARAASVVNVLGAASTGVTVRDSHADGTVLSIAIPARREPTRRTTHQLPRRKPC
jgi:hypothetical protein